MAPYKGTTGRNLGKLVKSFLNRNIGQTIRSSITATVTGGTTYEPGNGYKYHVFLTSTPTPEKNLTVSGDPTGINCGVLIVAGGGGGGGGYYSGGGGAGGVLYGGNVPLMPGPFTITVGAGGAGGPNASTAATEGGNSSFGSITAIGGGRGGGGPTTPNDPVAATAGGSNGGGSYYVGPGSPFPTTPQPAPSDYIAYGNTTDWSPGEGTGGGGAGEKGGPEATGTSSPDRQKGGAGIPLTGFEYPLIGLSPLAPHSPNNNHYGGGGSGGMPGNTIPGGYGGGGNSTPDGTGGDGVDHLGGGGGGGGNPSGAGGSGGDGIVVVRYQVDS